MWYLINKTVENFNRNVTDNAHYVNEFACCSYTELTSTWLKLIDKNAQENLLNFWIR